MSDITWNKFDLRIKTRKTQRSRIKEETRYQHR